MRTGQPLLSGQRLDLHRMLRHYLQPLLA
ncbi:MAG: hypothetical protein K0S03_967, partial [Burkholderiales bacterium]|nr:hypothetical protein [Burkholderiales bacterium]